METKSGYQLKCADDHILFDSEYNEILVKDCIPYKSYIITDNGPDLVVKVHNTEDKDNMYDIEVEDHKYYSNGILSHNTAFCAGYML
ncbi:MAG: Hint domain-containing protein [Halanaerobiales bacterium]